MFIIYPNSDFKTIFDSIILLLIIINLLLIPFKIGFLYYFLYNGSIVFRLVDYISDLFYILDIVFSFNTAFYNNNNNLIKNKKKIAIHYCFNTFGFLIDIVSALPISTLLNYYYNFIIFNRYVSNNLNNTYNTYNLYKLQDLDIQRMLILLIVLRLIKTTKIKNLNLYYIKKYLFIREIKRYIYWKISYKSIYKFNLMLIFINFVVKFFICLHIMSCFIVYLSYYDTKNNWIKKNNINNKDNNVLYTINSYNFDYIIDVYLMSIYFHLVTILTVGYGDLNSANIYEYSYFSIFMFLGIGIYSLAISFLSKFEIDDESKKNYNYNFNYLQHINRNYNLSSIIYNQALRQLNCIYKINKSTYINDMLDYLPNNLKKELVLNINKDLVNYFNMPNKSKSSTNTNNINLHYYNFNLDNKFFKFFKNDKDFVTKILLLLKLNVICKNEVLVKENQILEETYLIVDGSLSLKINYKSIDIYITSIAKKEHFGIYYMLLGKPCPVNIKAKTQNVELYILKHYDFKNLIVDQPNIFNPLYEVCSINAVRLNNQIILKKKQINSYISNNKFYDTNNKILFKSKNISITKKNK